MNVSCMFSYLLNPLTSKVAHSLLSLADTTESPDTESAPEGPSTSQAPTTPEAEGAEADAAGTKAPTDEDPKKSSNSSLAAPAPAAGKGPKTVESSGSSAYDTGNGYTITFLFVVLGIVISSI
jgi:hypothetical protein